VFDKGGLVFFSVQLDSSLGFLDSSGVRSFSVLVFFALASGVLLKHITSQTPREGNT
jgi:hypothetical protein